MVPFPLIVAEWRRADDTATECDRSSDSVDDRHKIGLPRLLSFLLGNEIAAGARERLHGTSTGAQRDAQRR